MLTLYKVGTRGRIQLEDLAVDGDFYTVAKADDGTITLSPVQVNTTGGKRPAAEATDTPQDDGDTAPFHVDGV